jgi:hypothetical protein
MPATALGRQQPRRGECDNQSAAREIGAVHPFGGAFASTNARRFAASVRPNAG